MNKPIAERVQRIMADLFSIPVGEASMEATPDTIDTWDSLNHLNLVLALEKEFGTRFTPQEVEQLLSVESISRLLDEKLRARAL
jgi:acyl carrier protein